MRLSLGLKLGVSLLLAMATIAAVYVSGEYARTTRLLHEQVELRARSMATAVRETIELAPEASMRRRAVNAFGAEPGLQMLAVVRGSALQVVAATRHAMIGQALASHVEADVLADVRDVLGGGRPRVGYRSESRSAYAVEPARIALGDGYDEPAVIAVLLDTHKVEAGALSSMFTDMLRFAAVLIVVALLVTVLLWNLVVRPLRQLRAVVDDRTAGDSTARVVVHGDGELAALGHAFNDMLHQVELEQQRVRSTAELLRSSERLLDIALSGASMGLWSLDLRNGGLQVDQRWLTLCAWQSSAVVLDERTEEALVHPEDLARLRTARAAHVNADSRDYECELRVGSADGGWRWVLDRGRVVEWGDAGEPLRMAGTRQDVNERKCAQLAMAGSERLLSTVLDNMPMPAFLKHRDGRFLLVNDYYLRCYDVRREDLLDHTAERAHEAAFAEQYMREDAEVIAKRQALRWDSRERVADGTIRDFSVTKFPVFDADGELIAIGGVTIDETERLQAMAAIRASEERLRSLTENLPGAVYRATADDAAQSSGWRIAYASEGMETVLGVPRASLLQTAQSFHALLHDDDRERVLASLRQGAVTETDFDIEYRLWVKPGDLRWVNDRGRFGRDATSGEASIDGLLLDITARKQAEFELTRQRTLFEAIFKSVPDAMCIADESRRVVLLNPGFERVMGYTNEDLLGHSTCEFYAVEADWEQQGASQFNARAGVTMSPDIVHYRRRDGRTFAGETVSSPIIGTAGELLGFVGITRDISARRQAEMELREARDRALDAARVKASFMANMSHELRTPMNGVLGMLDLLRETPLDAEQHECVEVARRSGESLMGLIAEVLDFSKLDSGQLQLEAVDFDLFECVDDVLRLVAEQAQQHNVELVARYAPGLPRVVSGDARRLRQVLVNLVGNAVKFTNDGDVLVSVRPVGDKQPDRLLFEVRDTGIGIPADSHERIFNAFVQGDASTTRRYGGSGLGLAICRGLVELMGGSIDVESMPGEGSRFCFDARFSLGSSGLSPQQPAAALRGRNVLLAVQHRPRAEALAEAIGQLGAQVVMAEAEAGAAVLPDAQTAPADLLVIDVDSAGGTALPRLCLLRAQACRPDLRVLLLNALGQRIEESVLTAAGVDSVLGKPVPVARLERCLFELLGEVRPPPSPDEDSAGNEAPPGLSRARVLVAEDAVVNQKVVTGMLARLGVEAELASDGAAALRAMDEHDFDLVLMDCQMPILDGVEATRRRRAIELERGIGRTPIVALTASAVASDRDLFLSAGMDGHLAKPLTINTLQACVRQYLPVDVHAGARPSADAEGDNVLDGRTLDEMYETLGEDTVREVVDAFLLGAGAFMAELRDCMERDDPGGAIASLHRMVGSAAAVGATSLLETCRTHEQRLREVDPSPPLATMGIDVAAIDKLLLATRAALRERIPGALAAAG